MTYLLDDTEIYVGRYSKCMLCKHIISSEYPARKCKAYDSIPEKIWMGEHDHTKPYKGDHGIRYEERT